MPFIKAIRLGNFADQSECFEFLLNELSPNLPPEKVDDLKEAVYLREDTASTYLDEGLAVPTEELRASTANTCLRGYANRASIGRRKIAALK